MSYEPERALADLQELAELTGGPEGANRLAWSPEWQAARDWLKGKLDEIGGLEVREDAAGNLWATRTSGADAVLVAGSHLDAVPAGGWLDGALGVCAALELVRHEARATVTLVDWADEEGARFGRSLLGSSAAAGTVDADAVRPLTDATGTTLREALAGRGYDLDRIGEARGGLDGAGAYLELHIEQGPTLEERGEAAGAVLGCYGVERHAVTFRGSASHAGATPMRVRHDAFLAAARFGLQTRAAAVAHEGVATIGSVLAGPGVPTIINDVCEVTLDQRALEPEQLAAMLADAHAAADGIAEDEGVGVEWEPLWSIDPVPFHPELVELAAQAVGADAHRLPSGALHDAAEAARLIPAVMLFTSSTGGISHSNREDTPEPDLVEALAAFGRLAELTQDWLLT